MHMRLCGSEGDTDVDRDLDLILSVESEDITTTTESKDMHIMIMVRRSLLMIGPRAGLLRNTVIGIVFDSVLVRAVSRSNSV